MRPPRGVRRFTLRNLILKDRRRKRFRQRFTCRAKRYGHGGESSDPGGAEQLRRAPDRRVHVRRFRWLAALRAGAGGAAVPPWALAGPKEAVAVAAMSGDRGRGLHAACSAWVVASSKAPVVAGIADFGAE
jgi:hypothetical protein